MDINPLKQDTIKIYNFGMEVIYHETGVLNHMELVKNFKLDVDYRDNAKGMFVTQIQNNKEVILKQPYNISDSARKVNKEIQHFANGFSRIEYAKKKNLVKYTNPPENIPIGCWCIHCEKIGPHGHSMKCALPNYSSLKLTLKGFIECLFSPDKTYQSKMLYINDYDKKNIIYNFMNEVLNHLDTNLKLNTNDKIKIVEDPEDMIDLHTIIDTKKLAAAVESIEDSIFIDISSKVGDEFYFLVKEEFKKNKVNEILTYFDLEDIKTIPGLNKSGKKEYFRGTVILQYSLLEKKTTIRFYDNFIHFITVPLDMNFVNVVKETFNRFNSAVDTNYVPLNVIIEVAKGSFNVISENSSDTHIDLNKLYDCFHPVDKYKNPIMKNDYMYIKEYKSQDGSVIRSNFTENEGVRYEFSVSRPENKRMTMSFIEYNILGKPGYYKITAQIHSSGIIQLTFGYTHGSKEYIKLDNSLKYNQREIIQVGKGIENLLEHQMNFINYLIKYQMENTVKKLFESTKNLFYNKLNDIREKSPDIFIKLDTEKKTSDRIYNIVPGVLPYRKKIFPHAGNLVDFFDDTNEEWKDNYGWSSDEKNRGYIVDILKNKDSKTIYRIIKGTPEKLPILKIDPIDQNFIPDKYNSAPIVETPKGLAYLLDEYSPDESDLFWVLPIKEDPVDYEYKNFRIYKYSITGKIDKGDVQVASKTVSGGTEMRPEPYSFFGRCVGGLNEYVDPIGIRSRKDNKFYPVCVKVKDRNVADKQLINYLLNGLTPEQLDEADINPEIEYELYGEKIDDKYAGTFKPGTIDKGNRVTFWDSDELNPRWVEGIIVDYKKDHGLGNDLNYVKFVIEVDTEFSELPKRYYVNGDQFHPMHRENRNITGLNKIYPDKEKQKIYLIECAKKLGIIKPTIPITESNESTRIRILAKLSKLYKHTFNFKKSTEKILPFVNNNIKNLEKDAYLAAIVPAHSVRCILYICDQFEQYIIDDVLRVMKVNIDTDDELPEQTVIEGYISDNRSFYPIDLSYFENTKENDDYIVSNNSGRLYKLQNIVTHFNTALKFSNSIKIESPLGKNIISMSSTENSTPFVGPTNDKSNLLKFVKKYIKKDNIIFIPQHMNGRFMIWRYNMPNVKLILQIVKKHEKLKNNWYLGLSSGNKKQVLLDIPIVLSKEFNEDDYIMFKLNITADGIINNTDPYVDISKVENAPANIEDSVEDTIDTINLLLYSVNKEVFENNSRWEFASIKTTYIAGNSFRDHLVKI